MGFNGAGKTTLLSASSGLAPHGAGSLHNEGGTLAPQSAAAIVKRGIVQFPETRELFGDLTAGENLDIAGLRLDKARRKVQLQWLFDLFPILATRRAQNARASSGGEQQMLAIARF